MASVIASAAAGAGPRSAGARTGARSGARGAALVPVLLGLLAVVALAAGCSAPPYRFIIDSTTTLPVEADDPFGIWHDRERRTPVRPLPKPIRGAVYELFFVPATPGDGAKETLAKHTYSDSHGCASMVGEVAEVAEGDRFRLVVTRKGFKPLERVFTREDIRDASVTVVMEALPGEIDPDAIGTTSRAPGTPIQRAGAAPGTGPIGPAAGPGEGR